jgi:hypothetical protein
MSFLLADRHAATSNHSRCLPGRRPPRQRRRGCDAPGLGAHDRLPCLPVPVVPCSSFPLFCLSLGGVILAPLFPFSLFGPPPASPLSVQSSVCRRRVRGGPLRRAQGAQSRGRGPRSRPAGGGGGGGRAERCGVGGARGRHRRGRGSRNARCTQKGRQAGRQAGGRGSAGGSRVSGSARQAREVTPRAAEGRAQLHTTPEGLPQGARPQGGEAPE